MSAHHTEPSPATEASTNRAPSDATQRRTSTWAQLLTHRAFPLIAAIGVVVLSLPSLWAEFEADDYFHRIHLLKMAEFPEWSGPAWDMFAFSYGDSDKVERLMDRGIAPWWTLPELKMAFCRPLSSLTHALDYALWPNSPMLMHAQNLLWIFLFVFGTGIAYRRLLGPTLIAGIAILVFTVDDAHATPAGWIAGRNTLVAATFGIWCLAAHDRWRRDGWKAGVIVAPLLFTLALLSAEAGVATLAYIVPHAMFIERGAIGKRLRGLAPYAVLTIIWRIAWAMRGYGVYGVGAYVDPVGSPFAFLSAVFEVAPILLLGQWALPPSDLYTFYDAIIPGLALGVWIVAVAILVACGYIIQRRLRGEPTMLFWATGMFFALIPICATADFPMDRLLLFVGIGASALLATFLHAVWRSRESVTAGAVRPPLYRVSLVLAIAFVLIHLVIAPISLVARTAAPAGPKRYSRQLYISLPDDPALTQRDIVVLNAPSGGLVGMFPVMQAVYDKPIPRRMRMLGPSLSAMAIERVDARSVRIVPDNGFMEWSYDHLVRSLDHPFVSGDRVDLPGMSAVVETVADDGRPASVLFTFDTELEDPQLLWLKWEDGAFKDFPIPAIGETVHLERALPNY